MISRKLFLEKLLSKTIIPAILVVDKKLNIEYHSLNTAQYLTLPKTFTNLTQLETRSKIAFSTIFQTAVSSIKNFKDVKVAENLYVNNKNYSINLTIQKLPTRSLKEVLFSISISKSKEVEVERLENFTQLDKTDKTQQVKFSENRLSNTQVDLDFLKKENEQLKIEYKNIQKNLDHLKTEYDINLSKQYELNFFMTEMLKNTNVATVFLNIEFQIIKYTPLLSKLFDVEKGDIGRKITDFNHIFISDDWNVYLKKAIKTGKRIEVKLAAKEDQYYLMIIKPAKFSHFKNNVLSVSFIDISNEVKNNQAKIESEQKFKTLFESAVDGMAIIDLDKGNFIASNKKMPQMLGITKTAYLQSKPINLLPKLQSDGTKSTELLEKLHDGLNQKGYVSIIAEYQHKTKGTFFARLSKYKFPAPQKNYAAVVLQNIDTEIKAIDALKQNQVQLQEAEGRYKYLFENSVDGIVVFNLEELKVVQVNQRLVKMSGFTKDEIIKKAPLGLLTEFLEDGSSTQQQYFKMLAELKTKKLCAGNFIHLHKTKAAFHVKVNISKMPKPHHHLIAVFIRDIDARKKVEAESARRLTQLKASEAMHKAFFYQSLDGHIILHKEDMMLVEVNEQMLQIMRISKTEYFKTDPGDFFDAENNTFDLAQTFNDFRACLQKNIPYEIEVYIKSKNRKSFLVKVLINQLPAPNEHLVYAVVKDIDKERKAEEATKMNLKALTISESRHKAFFNQSLDGHVIINLEDMMPVEVNKRMLQMLRISKTEYFANPFDLFDAEINPTKLEKMFQDLQVGLEKNNTFETEFYIKSSKRPSFLVKVLIHKLSAPNHHLAYAVIKDIDKERKAEEATKTHLKALTASESMHKAFFNQSLDGHIILHKEDMMLVDINQQMLKMLRISKRAYFETKTKSFNRSLPDFFDEANNTISKEQLYKNIAAQFEKNLPYEAEVYLSSKNRKPFLVRVLLNQLPSPNQHLVYAVIKDIDKERKAELESEKHLQALKTSESMFRTLFENGMDGFGIGQLLPHPKTINVNPAACKLLGMTKKEVLLANPIQLLSPSQDNEKSQTETMEKIVQSLHKNGHFAGDLQYVHKKNGSFYVKVKMVRLNAPHQDKVFTQVSNKDKEVKALQAVQKSEALFKSIFTNSLDGIVIYNIDNIKAIKFNERVLKMTKCTAQEFKNANLLDFLPKKQPNGKESFPIFKQYLAAVTENISIRKEFVFKKYQSNELVYTRISVIKLPMPFTNLAVLSIANITKTKLAEKAIIEKNQSIEQVNQQLNVSLQKFKDTFDNTSIYIARFNLDGHLIEHNTKVYNNLLEKNVVANKISVWNLPRFKKHKKSQQQVKLDFELAKKGQSTKSQVVYTVSPNFSGILEYTFKPLRNEQGDIFTILSEGYDVTEQVNALKKLKFNEQKFRAIYNNSNSFIGIFSTKGVILDHNQVLNEHLIEQESPTVGIPFWDFPWFAEGKNTPQKLKTGIKNAAKGKLVKGYGCYNKASGVKSNMQYSITPIFDEDGKVIWLLGEVTDITELANAQKNLKLKEQKFRAIFNNSINFIGIFNTTGIILELNQTVTDNLSQKEINTIGIPLWNFPWFLNHEDTQQVFKKAIRQAAKGLKVEGIVDYTVSANFSGTMQYTINPIFDDKDKVVWILGEGKDITEITNKNKELSYKEQKFRAIFNNSSNFIGLYDTDGYVDELNELLLKQNGEIELSGTTKKVKVWNRPLIKNHKESQKTFKASFEKALKGEISKGIMQYQPVVKNEIRIVEYTLSPIFDDSKKVIKVLGEGKDITEKLEVHKEIEASEKRFKDLFYNANNRVVRLSLEGKVIAHNKIHRGRKNYATTKKYIGKYLWDFLADGNTKTSFRKIKHDFNKAVKGELVSSTFSVTNAKNEKRILSYSLKPVFGAHKKVDWILGESNDITEFTNVQKQVLKNEQKFRAIFNNSSNFIGLYQLDGTIEELNKPILEQIPTRKQTKLIAGLKIWEIPLSNGFKKTIKQIFKDSLEKVLKGEVYKSTAQYSINATEDVCMEFTFSPVYNEYHKVFKVLGEARDITEQTNSKKQIEASEKKFKALFFNAENLVVRLAPNGRVIAHNKIQKENNDYDQIKNYIGKYLWELPDVVDNTEAQTQLKLHIKKAAKGNYVTGTIFSKGTNYVPLQLAYSLKPIFGADNKTVEWILGEARDITEFIETQNQLLENEQKFKAIFYNSENFIVRLDAKGNVLEHSRIHTSNPRYNIVKRYLGKPLWEFSGIMEHPESIAKLKKDIKACAAGKVISNQISIRIYKLDNKENKEAYKIGLVVYSLKPVFNKSNKVDWILAEAKDITALDNAKNELSISLNKYQKLFENNLVGILTLDENLKLIECNEAYEKITGYSHKDSVSFDYYALIDEDEIKEAKLNEHKIRTTKVKELQFKRTLIKKNGDKIFVHIYLKPIYYENKFSSAVVTIADITELENKRKALKQSEELYKAVFEGVNDGLYVYDVKKNEIVTFNEQLLQIAGVKTKSQFLKEANSLFIPYLKGKNQKKINWIRKIGGHLKHEKIAKFDFSFEKANGSLLDISTSTIKLSDALSLTAVTDITETKKAQNALLESETKYRSLFENNVTGIAMGNKSGEILQVNEALCAMFGYSKTEMLQLKHQDLTVQGADDQSYIHFKAMVDGKSKKFSATKEFVKKNGDTFYAIIFVSGIYNRQNNFKYNITSISDISELKHLENELKDKQIELADKVVELEKYIESNLELENFAFIASHDLKSPTQTIINFSNLLKQKAEGKLDEYEQQFLRYIIDGSNRLQDTINDLLNFSLANNNSLNIKKVNLNNLLNVVINDLDSVIKQTKATITINNLPPFNWVDEGLYKGLFLNLITNAMKFQKKGTRPLININCKKTPIGYLFSIEDNGIGIPKKSQQKIFGIFKRLHVYSEFEGTGIGLALCKKVVERHQGKIWVESAKGKGAKFYFTLPENLSI